MPGLQMDLVSAKERRRLLGMLRTLNPGADILPTRQSAVPLARVINTRRFNFEKAAQSAGWLKVGTGVHVWWVCWERKPWGEGGQGRPPTSHLPHTTGAVLTVWPHPPSCPHAPTDTRGGLCPPV